MCRTSPASNEQVVNTRCLPTPTTAANRLQKDKRLHKLNKSFDVRWKFYVRGTTNLPFSYNVRRAVKWIESYRMLKSLCHANTFLVIVYTNGCQTKASWTRKSFHGTWWIDVRAVQDTFHFPCIHRNKLSDVALDTWRQRRFLSNFTPVRPSK